MYREKIREYYDHLSRSYRRVADFIMSNYYEVSFMTAAQLAIAVGVDTTTVVRFSQRIGYNGYPELLSDIRDQVRSEIYATYTPKRLAEDDKAAIFKGFVEQERQNLAQMLTHCPPEQVEAIANKLTRAGHIVLMAEGYAEAIVQMTAEQFRHRGVSAEAVTGDPVKRAGTLIQLQSNTLVIGVGATDYGRDVARAMSFARSKGCATLGVVGSLSSPINRVSDLVIYAPTKSESPLPSIIALTTALSALVQLASKSNATAIEKHIDAFNAAFLFLIQPDSIIEDEDAADRQARS